MLKVMDYVDMAANVLGYAVIGVVVVIAGPPVLALALATREAVTEVATIGLLLFGIAGMVVWFGFIGVVLFGAEAF